MNAPRKPKSIKPGLHVLIVDDDANVLRDVSTQLTVEGHRVSVFSRAAGVRQLVRVLKPQVLLIDVLMPDLNKRLLLDLLAAQGLSVTITPPADPKK